MRTIFELPATPLGDIIIFFGSIALFFCQDQSSQGGLSANIQDVFSCFPNENRGNNPPKGKASINPIHAINRVSID
jgi:hypothetical protein